MKKFLKYAVLTVLVFMPRLAFADFDITSYLTQLVNSAQRDGIGKVMKDQISGLQTDSMNLVSPDFSNINPDQVKDLALKAYKEADKKLHISNKLPSGLAAKINSTGSNPDLENAAKKEFTVSKRSGDDVQKNQQLKEKANELMIENVSLMYARGLVRRYQLENEKIEEVDDLNNVNAVQSLFVNTVHRADNRWISMLESESSLMAQNSMIQLNNIRVDEEEEKTENKESTDKKSSEATDKNASSDNKTADKDNDENKGSDEDKEKSKLEKAGDWAKQQGEKVGDWLSEDKNQEGVNKIIHGLFGDDSQVGSALTGATNSLADQSRERNNNKDGDKGNKEGDKGKSDNSEDKPK